MKEADGATRSCWGELAATPSRKGPLPKHFDACIVGAGIAGLTTAYLLCKEGLSVLVVDEGPVGVGQSGRTSAHLASAIDDRFLEIEKTHGIEHAKIAYESHAAAIDLIEWLTGELGINCDFRRVDGFLSRRPSDAEDLLKKEFEAAKRAGVRDIELLDSGGFGGGPRIRFGHQARFEPLHYLEGLQKSIADLGGQFLIGKRVRDMAGGDTKTGKAVAVTLAGGEVIRCTYGIAATNVPAPINDWAGIYTKQAPFRTYVVAIEAPDCTLEDALHWDTGDPYHYVRYHFRDGHPPLLLVGGEDHKTGQQGDKDTPFGSLEIWARELFGNLGNVSFRWSGQVNEPVDGLAFIGRALTKGDNVFVITGDSGMGLTHGTMGGMIIRDIIGNRPNSWAKLYDPGRKTVNLEFVSENLNNAKQYADYLMPGEVSSVDDIPKGQGAVIREGLSKIAAFRDASGKLHKCSAVCTHLQCPVRWNAIEKSWDCTCHGSRFDPLGKVLMGPAIDDLPKA